MRSSELSRKRARVYSSPSCASGLPYPVNIRCQVTPVRIITLSQRTPLCSTMASAPTRHGSETPLSYGFNTECILTHRLPRCAATPPAARSNAPRMEGLFNAHDAI